MTTLVDVVHPPGEPWTSIVARGQHLRITDLEGTQAVDTLLYNAEDPRERYSSADTIRAQGNIFLTEGSVLLSNRGRAMATVVKDTCGRHDTVGGACSAESNTCRFGHRTRSMHNCRDNFLVGLARHGLGKRDLVPNINFFMYVPVTPDGHLDIVDGVSQPADLVEIRAEMDVLIVISNCPQLNNPCNGWNPTPIGLTVLAPA
ncbi:MAG: urea amidolyase associated protein UAAP2 [Acidimicrobiales bacterium]